jgi:hypothetical protein
MRIGRTGTLNTSFVSRLAKSCRHEQRLRLPRNRRESGARRGAGTAGVHRQPGSSAMAGIAHSGRPLRRLCTAEIPLRPYGSTTSRRAQTSIVVDANEHWRFVKAGAGWPLVSSLTLPCPRPAGRRTRPFYEQRCRSNRDVGHRFSRLPYRGAWAPKWDSAWDQIDESSLCHVRKHRPRLREADPSIA